MTTDEPDPGAGSAEMVGVTPAAFTARIGRVRSQLTAGAVQAQQRAAGSRRGTGGRGFGCRRGGEWITPWTWTNRTRS